MSFSDLMIEELITAYKEAAVRHKVGTNSANHVEANDAYAALAATFGEIRSRGVEGTKALEALLDDANVGVRTWAASHLITLGSKKAERVLEAIAGGAPSLNRLSAKMVLREWRAGRLSFP